MDGRLYELGSNNTNKLSPQERRPSVRLEVAGSNNTNKLSPQEPDGKMLVVAFVQIIQINLVLKNAGSYRGNSN